eukprot:tig00021179_g19246.t1
MGSACCKKGPRDRRKAAAKQLQSPPARGSSQAAQKPAAAAAGATTQPRSTSPTHSSARPPTQAQDAHAGASSKDVDAVADPSDLAISLASAPAAATRTTPAQACAPSTPQLQSTSRSVPAHPSAHGQQQQQPPPAPATSPRPAASKPPAAVTASAAAAAAAASPAPSASSARAPAFAAELEELRYLQSLETASSVGQLAGLCALLREAKRQGPASEAARRAAQVPLLNEIYTGDVDDALAEAQEACFNALDAFGERERHRPEEISEACAVVRSGDPELCSRLLEVLLRLRDGTVLEAIPTTRIGALVDVLGRLPRGTLTSTQRSRLVAFCLRQLKDLSPKLAPGDVDALAALQLVPAVLAAFDSESDGAAFAAEEDEQEADGAGRLDYEGTVRELEASLRAFEGCGWWRAEVAASVARQALAAARSSYDPLQDAFTRVKAAGRIVAKLYSAGRTVMEGISSFGAITLIDLAVFVKDALSGDLGVKAVVQELWADLGRLVGAGSPQGKKCWYRPARLLAALAEGGHLEELQMALEAMGGASAAVAHPKLVAAVCAALLSAVEALGGDAKAALAAVDVARALADAALAAAAAPQVKKAASKAAIASATAAVQALASIAASEVGGQATEAATKRLEQLAQKDDPFAGEALKATTSLLGASIEDLKAAGFKPKRTLKRSACLRLNAPKASSELLRTAVTRLVRDPNETVIRSALHSYGEQELAKRDLRDGIALYVPPKATTDPELRNVVDILSYTTAFLARTLPGATEGAPRALLVAGEPGSSKSTFLVFLHRLACEQWRRTHGRQPRGDQRLPVTCLLRLPRLGRETVACGLRAAAARALSVPEATLTKIRDSRGLVLLLDAYDELESRDAPPPRLWPDNELVDWVSAVIVTCRSSLLAAQRGYAELFAPSDPSGALEPLDHVCMHPFNSEQVEDYLKQFVALPAELRERSCNWTADEYLSHIKRIPGTLALIENPFTLNMVARTLPKLVSQRESSKAEIDASTCTSLLTIRELYDAFVEGWFGRQWDRVRNKGAQLSIDLSGWDKQEFETYGRSFCRDLATAMFEASISEFASPLQRPKGADRKPRYAAAAAVLAEDGAKQGGEQSDCRDPLKACIDLMQSQDSPMEVFIRDHCPLHISEAAPAGRQPRASEGGRDDREAIASAPRAVHVRFLHKTLLEYFVAEEMFEKAIARSALAVGSVRRQRRASFWSAAGAGLIHKTLLTGEPKILEFLAECCRGDKLYCTKLLGLLDQSRDPRAAKQDLIASANAMTILNRAGYSFAGSDLRGVRMPGADLQRLEAAGADLRGADLTGCGLQEANLAGADLRGAKLNGCAVIATPALWCTSHPKTFVKGVARLSVRTDDFKLCGRSCSDFIYECRTEEEF